MSYRYPRTLRQRLRSALWLLRCAFRALRPAPAPELVCKECSSTMEVRWFLTIPSGCEDRPEFWDNDAAGGPADGPYWCHACGDDRESVATQHAPWKTDERRTI